MKYSGIGGQAVIEGIMMKNKQDYATAVRKPDGAIAMQRDTYVSLSDKVKLFSLPFIRGTFAFIDSFVLGMKTLSFSAGIYEGGEEAQESEAQESEAQEGESQEGEAQTGEEGGGEETRHSACGHGAVPDANEATPETSTETPARAGSLQEKGSGGKLEKAVVALTMAVSIVLAVGIFMVLPMFISGLFTRILPTHAARAVLEGFIRIGIFVAYIKLVSRMEDIRRTFMYHGAEHKCINCLEHGLELTVDNVRSSSKQHKRCGTSFLLIVMVISILVFMVVRTDTLWLRALSRIVLIPVIAGISYEFLRVAGRSDSKLVDILSKPGMWMQNLTTKEPDDSMIEVAIVAVEAVFDWKEYLRENFGDDLAGNA
ncbi:MAG: DUF1385 domain-containing protein [Lachnospiraceae bacterium]|nr:DUF1385 domain-containing protein [Lachnospiraceae bacterium]